jgi:hypothetical protein
VGIIESLLVLVAGGLLYVSYRLIRDPRQLLKNFLSVKELGLYEGRLHDLERVVIVLHQIEDPKDSLREAVGKNIGRGVRYLFLVSRSRYQEEKELGYNIFKSLAEMVLRKGQQSLKVEEVVNIESLPYDWEDTPYIFYELHEHERPGVRRVIGIKGNQAREGIAEGYIKMDPAYARTIHRAVVLRALEPVHFDKSVDELTYGERGNEVTLETRSLN